MKCYFIRHGATKGNEERRYVGRTDEGIQFGAQKKLKEQKKHLPVMDYIFVSPYLRCVQSAHILFGPAEEKTEQVEGFREMDFGEFEYKNYRELNGNPHYQSFIDSGGAIAFPGGEEPEAFKERCRRAFADCMEKAIKNNWETIAFVVHGGTIMAILEAFGRPSKGYYEYQTENGSGFCAVSAAEKSGNGKRFYLTVEEKLLVEEDCPQKKSSRKKP